MIRYSRYVSLLAVCILSGCANLPDQQKSAWPWEYGRGQGEPKTNDHFIFRAGVANFGEQPKAAKPVRTESVQAPVPDVQPSSAAPATRTEPAEERSRETDKITGTSKKDYDFRVKEKTSPSSASFLQMDTNSSSKDIAAFNNGNAPVSVAIDIDRTASQNASADKTLPYYAIVPANTDRSLMQLSPKKTGMPFNFRFSYQWTIGDYTARHYCPENYRFPFGTKIRAFASVSDGKNATAYTRHAIVFTLPEGTPVLAARKGTVIRINPGDKIDILHDDSTIGTYSHLEKIAGNIAVGNSVTTGDLIGIAARAENTKEAYLQLTVWRPEPLKNDALLTNARQMGFDAVSFPLPFSIADSDSGTVLTQSQPVSRVKLPSSAKQTKRK